MKVGVEPLNQQIPLPMSHGEGPVNRTAVAVGSLLLQSVGQGDLHSLTPYGRYVQVFIVGLWRTEAC